MVWCWSGCAHCPQIVAWGVHPIVSKDYRVVLGNFKTGLLKGKPDPWIDRYRR